MIRYPRPLVAGDVVGVTAPSAGVDDALRRRLAVALETVRGHGFETRVGRMMAADGITSGPADERAAELTALMTDPAVRAVVPPWGGETAIDLLDRLDWDALADDPTWLVGYSDISTLLLPLTLLTGVATLHSQNLMDTPYRVPRPLLGWTDVVTAAPGAVLTQGAAERYRSGGWADYAAHPTDDEYVLDTLAGWVRLDADDDVAVTGRLVGGCLETVANLAGTPYGDLGRFAREHAPEGLVVYLEVCEVGAAEAARRLFQLRYAGWFADARAVLVGRTDAPASGTFTQHDAVLDALGGLGVPILADLDLGHVPPMMSLVNGAMTTVRHSASGSALVQRLI